jgi:hypothetical protein
MKTLLAAASALILSAGLASAATTNSTAGGQSQANAATTSNQTQANAATPSGPTAKMRQQLEESLAKAGFTDIKIMPESFLIRAKDQNGNPMMMVVNPDSVTEVEAVTPNKAKNNNNANAATNNANGSTANSSTTKQ